MPAFTLEALTVETTNSSSLAVIKNYNKMIDNILNPPVQERTVTVETAFSYGTKGKVINHSNLEESTKKEWKKLTAILHEQDAISPKFHLALKEIGKENNLVAIEEDIRQKAISRLEALGTTEALQMVNILKMVVKEMTVEERIMKQKLSDGFQESVSAILPTIGTKKTLAQLIAEKKAGK